LVYPRALQFIPNQLQEQNPSRYNCRNFISGKTTRRK
jgi:hypothetical protein